MMTAISDTSGIVKPICLEHSSIVQEKPALGIIRDQICCVGIIQNHYDEHGHKTGYSGRSIFGGVDHYGDDSDE